MLSLVGSGLLSLAIIRWELEQLYTHSLCYTVHLHCTCPLCYAVHLHCACPLCYKGKSEGRMACWLLYEGQDRYPRWQSLFTALRKRETSTGTREEACNAKHFVTWDKESYKIYKNFSVSQQSQTWILDKNFLTFFF